MGGAEALWRFARTVYERPGVAAACLDLQDRRRRNVCLLLYALWAGAACGRRLTPDELATAEAAAAPWHRDVVERLRGVRRGLEEGPPPAPSPHTEPLRRRLGEIEIEAERIELATLAAILPLAPAPALPRETARAAAEANLELVCPAREAPDRASFATLLDAAIEGS